MKPEWEPDELVDTWTLAGSDWDPIASKAGVTGLGFAVLLKFYEIEGRLGPLARRAELCYNKSL